MLEDQQDLKVHLESLELTEYEECLEQMDLPDPRARLGIKEFRDRLDLKARQGTLEVQGLLDCRVFGELLADQESQGPEEMLGIQDCQGKMVRMASLVTQVYRVWEDLRGAQEIRAQWDYRDRRGPQDHMAQQGPEETLEEKDHQDLWELQGLQVQRGKEEQRGLLDLEVFRELMGNGGKMG